MKNNSYFIVILMILILFGVFGYHLYQTRNIKELSSKTQPTLNTIVTPTPTPTPTSQLPVFNRSSDLLQGLQSVKPEVSDTDFQKLDQTINSL